MEAVVVTGFGVICPLGHVVDDFWAAVLRGESGISEVSGFDTSRYRVKRGAEIKESARALHRHLSEPEMEQLGRTTQLALFAARDALEDAGLSRVDADRTGVVMGTTSGEPREIERFNDLDLSGKLNELGEQFTLRYPCNQIPGHVASSIGAFGGGGPIMLPVACAAGSCAITHAVDMLQLGEADVMLAGGADSFSRITYTGFAGLMAIAPERCQPFDLHRKGMMPGEGAAFLVLERAGHARERGARVYAEVAGYGLSCDAIHMTGGDRDGRGAVRAMEKALSRSRVSPDEIDYISAHGTGTKTSDLRETKAVKQVFEDSAKKVPMSSVKSMFGHTMGAASAIEAGVCCLAIDRGAVPPTMNLESPDPDCDLDYVPNEARECEVEIAMSNAYAFGGANASLILKKWRS